MLTTVKFINFSFSMNLKVTKILRNSLRSFKNSHPVLLRNRAEKNKLILKLVLQDSSRYQGAAWTSKSQPGGKTDLHQSV